jgi:hypothetical protein
MPFFSPLRAGCRCLAWSSLSVGLAIVPAGCELMNPAAPAAIPEESRTDILPRGADPAGSLLGSAATPPGKFATRRGHYVFYHDFKLEAVEPLLAELEALPDQVYGELGLPPTTRIIQVFLFDTQDRYERYMKSRYRTGHGSLPTRRAYFIREPRIGGAGDDLKVFTWMGDHLRTDLRHELTHALLHGVLKDVPLWLDEGLAGYFELPMDYQGVNPQHLELLRRGPFQPDLSRLETLEQVGQMEKPEYREAWAWVHLMLRHPAAKSVLQTYLQNLRTTESPGPLQPRLKQALPDPDRALAEHLGSLQMP